MAKTILPRKLISDQVNTTNFCIFHQIFMMLIWVLLLAKKTMKDDFEMVSIIFFY